MFQETALSGQITFFQKLRSLDYILLFCLLILGLVSSLSMYSTEGGEVLYHTKSHVIRFIVFFSMMLIFSFVNLKLWHSIGYIFYFVVLCLLIWASLYGVKASGSQRWVDLYFINLQPSELMKVAIIMCFAKFYHRTQIHLVNNFKNLIIPMVVLIVPILLVVSQPDLGTSIWLAYN